MVSFTKIIILLGGITTKMGTPACGHFFALRKQHFHGELQKNDGSNCDSPREINDQLEKSRLEL